MEEIKTKRKNVVLETFLAVSKMEDGAQLIMTRKTKIISKLNLVNS